MFVAIDHATKYTYICKASLKSAKELENMPPISYTMAINTLSITIIKRFLLLRFPWS